MSALKGKCKGGAAVLALGAGLWMACQRDFDGPYMPGSPSFAGDAWTRDKDRNGVADSVEKYAPGCRLTPAQCLEAAQALARAQHQPAALAARDMILWLGEKGVAPRLTWTPPELSFKGFVLASSDSAKVWPGTGALDALSEGNVQVTVTVPRDSLAADFLVKVVSQGVPAQGLSAADMLIPVGRDTMPALAWLPSDATYREYSLSGDNPVVVSFLGGRLRGITPGAATVVAEALDGGYRAVFSVTVEDAPPVRLTDSVSAEDMFMIALDSAQAPVLQWAPDNVTSRKYLLVTGDTNVVAVTREKDRLLPRGEGQAKVIVLALDGSGKSSEFTAHVSLTAVPVAGLSAEDMKLSTGSEPVAPRLTWIPALATNRKYALVSSNPRVATAWNNLVNPLSPGQAAFTVTSADGGFADSFLVTVDSPDTSVHVDSVRAADMTLALGGDRRPSLTWFPENAGNRAYTLVSLDTAVAVAADEFVHPVQTGTATFQVLTQDMGRSSIFNVSVYAPVIPVQSITVAPMSMVLGDPDRVPEVAFTPANATNRKFNLYTETPAVATISGIDKVHAVALGTATITVLAADNVLGKLTVTVNAKPIPVTGLSASHFSMRLGDADKAPPLTWYPSNATNKTFTVKSGNAAVATVVGTSVHAVGPGKSALTVEALDGSKPTAVCTVTVEVLVQSLSARDTVYRMGDPDLDASRLLTWTPANASNKSFNLRSLDSSVIMTVNSGLTLRGLKGGSAKVSVSALDGSGKRDTFTVTVTVPVLSITAAGLTMRVGDPDKDPALTWNPANATNKGYTLSGGTAGVATVVANRVHAAGYGSANFTVTSADGNRTATFAVTIPVPVNSVTGSDLTMPLGSADRDPVLTWDPPNASNKGYSLSSASPSIVSIVGNRLHAAGAGTAQVTVTAADGNKTDVFAVTVTVPVASITVAPVTMHKGDADRDPVITWNPANASNKNYTLSGGSGTVATVVANRIHVVGGGSTSMTVLTQDGGKTANFTITVPVPVQDIQAADIVMSENDPDALPVLTWIPADATNKGYTLKSLDPFTISIVNNKIHPLRRGRGDVSVTTNDGNHTAQFQVTVGH